jgi:hypothetical protein
MRRPPDLSQPYSSEAERAGAREALLLYCYAIEVLTKLVELPASEWSPQQTSAFPSSVPNGPPEPPQHRLQRWVNLYGDEIRIIREVRNRLVHGGVVADSELRSATYLARSIVATVMGVLPSEAESAARKVLALAA